MSGNCFMTLSTDSRDKSNCVLKTKSFTLIVQIEMCIPYQQYIMAHLRSQKGVKIGSKGLNTMRDN